MSRKSSGQSLKVGITNGRAWIATRTFDGIETDLSYNLEDLNLEEVRLIHGELGMLIPAMEVTDFAEKEKRRDDLLKAQRDIKRQLEAIGRELDTLPAPAPAPQKESVSKPHVCRECGKIGCDGEGVGHYRG